jgi:protein O-mannosyl-transferase
MNPNSEHQHTTRINRTGWWLLFAAFALIIAVYWPGLSGGFLFDDYPNIVDNHGVQPQDASFPSLVGAALSSPSSEFKRPLASLSFAANYLTTGIDPYWMKLTNLIIHLLNGLLVFLLAHALLSSVSMGAHLAHDAAIRSSTGCAPTKVRADMVATLIAAGWMLLPINLTGVLYVVQRMESMANLFVLLGLLGYVKGRQSMLEAAQPDAADSHQSGFSSEIRGFILCLSSIVACTGVGVLAKETAVMLPLYAALIEWTVFRFHTYTGQRDNRLLGMFLVLLLLPMILGLAWLLPQVFEPAYWSTRDFDLRTRLLSEARIVVDYIRWTLLPTPDALSFYHDDFRISTGLLMPWTTFASVGLLGTLTALMIWLRRRQPLTALGIALFFGCQLLTGTILPLELIYEHRNYFASFGLLLAIMPLLAVPRTSAFALPRHTLLAGLFLCWTALTAFTSYAWGNPLRLAEDLASRASQSPRAQYELGRTYIIYSHYEPTSPFTSLAYTPLEKAASLPNSSILPEQALIFMNARMHLPLKDAWWDSLTVKLKTRRPGVQDESSLGALTQCAREQRCNLPTDRMMQAFIAALSHPDPSARLLATYGDYAWNVLDDHPLGERMTAEAVHTAPNEPAYLITQVRMLAAQGRDAEAKQALKQLESLNIGGRLNNGLTELRALPSLH